jgi:hypothetical protein
VGASSQLDETGGAGRLAILWVGVCLGAGGQHILLARACTTSLARRPSGAGSHPGFSSFGVLSACASGIRGPDILQLPRGDGAPTSSEFCSAVAGGPVV